MTELPSSWYVKNDGSQLFKDTVVKYLNYNCNKEYDGSVLNSNYGVGDNGNADYWGNPNNFGDNAVELTLNQFIKLTTKSNMKEIIGYRLKDDCKQYEDAARKIVAGESREVYVDGTYEVSGTASAELNEAGVLDLWFEKVYKEDKLKVVAGTYFYCIKDVVMKPSGIIDYNVDKVYRSEQDGHIADNRSPRHSWTEGVDKFFRKATTQEIEAHLIAQAKEKGFNTYTRFTAVRDTVKGDITISRAVSTDYGYTKEGGECGSSFVYDPSKDALLTSGCGLYVVYEQGKWATITPKEEIVFVGGKFDVKIKDGKIYHKSDDITTFVKELVAYAEVATFSIYAVKIKDITFSKTGCQDVQTTLGDWLHVWDMYNKLQK